MWYRNVLAYMLKKPKYVGHQTSTKYKKPIFSLSSDDPTSTLGAGSKVYGPGHYTSSSEEVLKGYAKTLPIRRREKLPIGTNIINLNQTPQDELQKVYDVILDMIDKKDNSVFLKTEQPVDIKDIKSLKDLSKIYFSYNRDLINVLLKAGFDVMEYMPFERVELPRKPLETDEEYKNRLKKVQSENNYLIFNALMFDDPKLFQKSKFRPEALSEEEKQTIEKIQNKSEKEIQLEIFKSGSFKGFISMDDFLKLKDYIDPKILIPYVRLHNPDIDGKYLMDFVDKNPDVLSKKDVLKAFFNSLELVKFVNEFAITDFDQLLEFIYESPSKVNYYDMRYVLTLMKKGNITPEEGLKVIIEKSEDRFKSDFFNTIVTSPETYEGYINFEMVLPHLDQFSVLLMAPLTITKLLDYFNENNLTDSEFYKKILDQAPFEQIMSSVESGKISIENYNKYIDMKSDQKFIDGIFLAIVNSYFEKNIGDKDLVKKIFVKLSEYRVVQFDNVEFLTTWTKYNHYAEPNTLMHLINIVDPELALSKIKKINLHTFNRLLNQTLLDPKIIAKYAIYKSSDLYDLLKILESNIPLTVDDLKLIQLPVGVYTLKKLIQEKGFTTEDLKNVKINKIQKLEELCEYFNLGFEDIDFNKTSLLSVSMYDVEKSIERFNPEIVKKAFPYVKGIDIEALIDLLIKKNQLNLLTTEFWNSRKTFDYEQSGQISFQDVEKLVNQGYSVEFLSPFVRDLSLEEAIYLVRQGGNKNEVFSRISARKTPKNEDDVVKVLNQNKDLIPDLLVALRGKINYKIYQSIYQKIPETLDQLSNFGNLLMRNITDTNINEKLTNLNLEDPISSLQVLLEAYKISGGMHTYDRLFLKEDNFEELRNVFNTFENIFVDTMKKFQEKLLDHLVSSLKELKYIKSNAPYLDLGSLNKSKNRINSIRTSYVNIENLCNQFRDYFRDTATPDDDDYVEEEDLTVRDYLIQLSDYDFDSLLTEIDKTIKEVCPRCSNTGKPKKDMENDPNQLTNHTCQKCGYQYFVSS